MTAFYLGAAGVALVALGFCARYLVELVIEARAARRLRRIMAAQAYMERRMRDEQRGMTAAERREYRRTFDSRAWVRALPNELQRGANRKPERPDRGYRPHAVSEMLGLR